MAEKTQSYCNQCTGFRWHEVLHTEKTSWREDIYEHGRIEGDDVYEMLKDINTNVSKLVDLNGNHYPKLGAE